MRQILNPPQLLSPAYCSAQFHSTALSKTLKLPPFESPDDFVQQSAKLIYLQTMLKEILKEHKVLIFSQFKGMLQLVADFLQAKGILSLTLTGDTPNSHRQKLIDKF